MKEVYQKDKFHVCVLPNANRKWQVGQLYGCDCGNIFRVRAYYEGQGFMFFGKIEQD